MLMLKWRHEIKLYHINLRPSAKGIRAYVFVSEHEHRIVCFFTMSSLSQCHNVLVWFLPFGFFPICFSAGCIFVESLVFSLRCFCYFLFYRMLLVCLFLYLLLFVFLCFIVVSCVLFFLFSLCFLCFPCFFLVFSLFVPCFLFVFSLFFFTC